MNKTKWKGGALLAPVPPTMVTSSFEGKDNVFTVAWTGIINTRPAKTYVSVRPERYSCDLIKKSGEFVINLTTADMCRNADLCGIYSGKNVDKFEKYGIAKSKSFEVSCPSLEDSPVCLECKVTDVIELGTHHMFLADIVCVSVDESLINKVGKLCLSKANLAAYAHGEYFELGKRIGTFGYSVRKKHKSAKQGKPQARKPKK